MLIGDIWENAVFLQPPSPRVFSPNVNQHFRLPLQMPASDYSVADWKTDFSLFSPAENPFSLADGFSTMSSLAR